MDLDRLCDKVPELDALLRDLVGQHSGRDGYRYRLTAQRLRRLGIGTGPDQGDVWLERLQLLARQGWFDFEPAAEDRLVGSRLGVGIEQRDRLAVRFPDDDQAFRAAWPSRVEAAPWRDWLLEHPPEPAWARELDWPRALDRLPRLSTGVDYSGQQLGAFLFGDAKVAERSGRARDWLAALGEQCGWRLVERGLLLHAHLPEGVRRIALIENQDTYLRLIEAHGDRLGCLFVAGNRAASRRLLERRQCYFGYSARSHPTAIRHFEAFWFDGATAGYDMRYWGDLDGEGLAILARMQSLLPGLRPWMAAYHAMARLLPDGDAFDWREANLARLLEYGEVHQEAVLDLNQLAWDEANGDT